MKYVIYTAELTRETVNNGILRMNANYGNNKSLFELVNISVYNFVSSSDCVQIQNESTLYS